MQTKQQHMGQTNDTSNACGDITCSCYQLMALLLSCCLAGAAVTNPSAPLNSLLSLHGSLQFAALCTHQLQKLQVHALQQTVA
jgi:hypothetical protein